MESKRIIVPRNSDTEADTCRKEVTPRLYASEWTDEQILEQRTFTDGKIVVLGKVAKRQKPKKADYILRIGQNFPIAVIEAKKKYKTAAAGLQQAKDYAETWIAGLPMQPTARKSWSLILSRDWKLSLRNIRPHRNFGTGYTPPIPYPKALKKSC